MVAFIAGSLVTQIPTGAARTYMKNVSRFLPRRVANRRSGSKPWLRNIGVAQ